MLYVSFIVLISWEYKMNDNNKKKRFKLFDYQREGKGISKNQPELAPGFKKFFISYKNNFISDKSFIFPN